MFSVAPSSSSSRWDEVIASAWKWKSEERRRRRQRGSSLSHWPAAWWRVALPQCFLMFAPPFLLSLPGLWAVKQPESSFPAIGWSGGCQWPTHCTCAAPVPLCRFPPQRQTVPLWSDLQLSQTITATSGTNSGCSPVTGKKKPGSELSTGSQWSIVLLGVSVAVAQEGNKQQAVFKEATVLHCTITGYNGPVPPSAD